MSRALLPLRSAFALLMMASGNARRVRLICVRRRHVQNAVEKWYSSASHIAGRDDFLCHQGVVNSNDGTNIKELHPSVDTRKCLEKPDSAVCFLSQASEMPKTGSFVAEIDSVVAAFSLNIPWR